MSAINKTFSTIVFMFFMLSVYGSPEKQDSVRYEVLMSTSLLNELQINSNFVPAVDVTSKRLILLSSTDQFYLLGWGGMVPLGNKVATGIGAFAFTSDSLLMVIRNNELCYLDSLGKLSFLYKLPEHGMGISTGKYAMYIYDRNSTKSKHALYALAGGGKYAKLFDVPGPISSVVEWNDRILFSTGNALLQYNLKTKEIKALAALPEGKIIKSLAVDPSEGRIFFSTANMICTVKDEKVSVITDKLGGTIRYFNGLMVLKPESSLLIRMVGIDRAIASASLPVKSSLNADLSVEILTNSTIIELVKNELSDELIISIVNHSKVDFNLNVDSMIDLSNQGISSKVILAMKRAMKTQEIEKK
jgi:hypothetical protein